MKSNDESKHPVIRPFSLPLLCRPDKSNLVSVGDNIIIINLDGTRLSGKLHSTDFEHEYIEIDVDSQNDPVKVKYTETKLITLHDFRQWIDQKEIPDGNFIPEKPQELDFQIKFKDGDELKGITLGYYLTNDGIFLYPRQESNCFIYSFVPHVSIEQYQFGPKIGEQLVADKLVTREHVDLALNEQNEIRNTPLGEYLTKHALVTINELKRALENQKNIKNVRLGELLVSEQIITEEQLELALKIQQKDRSMQLGQILVKQGKVTDKQIHQSLARKLGIPYVDLNQIDVDLEALSRLPENTARTYEVLPLSVFDNKLVIAINNPLDWKTLENIRFAVNMNVIPVMSSVDEIITAINNHYSLVTTDDVVFEDESENVESENEAPAVTDNVDDNVVVRMVNKIIIDAYNMNASDIHIEPQPGKKNTLIRMRKAGTLIPYHEVAPGLRKSLVMRIKVMANLNTSEKRMPQDGKINFGKFGPAKIELRIATIPTAGDEEDVVIRLLSGSKPTGINELFMSDGNLECTKYVLNNPYGLFFVCGPTGSGKTTTLHSLLSHLNTPDRKIWTVEDPVEYTQKGIRQVQVHPKIGLDFASTLRSFMRADPDIIMVGEMRDKETTSICINASLTGHLVLSTLHTNSAIESIVRLLEMGMDPFNFSDALLGILAQRLVKMSCRKCQTSHIADESEIEKLIDEYCYDFRRVNASKTDDSDPLRLKNTWKSRFSDKDGNILLHGNAGCKTCDKTGFNNRLALHEMLMASSPIKMAISRRASVNELLQMALDEGMRTISQDGIEKILQGLTNIKQVRKYSIRL